MDSPYDTHIKFSAAHKSLFNASLNILTIAQELPLTMTRIVFLMHFAMLTITFYNLDMFTAWRISPPEVTFRWIIILSVLAEIGFFAAALTVVNLPQKYLDHK